MHFAFTNNTLRINFSQRIIYAEHIYGTNNGRQASKYDNNNRNDLVNEVMVCLLSEPTASLHTLVNCQECNAAGRGWCEVDRLVRSGAIAIS